MHKLTDNQEAWLTALETGDYDQTTGNLNDQDGFCCLGVACDIATEIGHWEGSGSVRGFMPNEPNHLDSINHSGLSPQMQVWLGVYGALGQFKDDHSFDLARSKGNSLTDLNDFGGMSFKEIATFVRENLTSVFKPSK